MLTSVPLFVTIVFIATVCITAIFLFTAIISSAKARSVKPPVWFFIVALAWLELQGMLANKGFYLNTSSFPPRFVLAVAPALIFIIILFITSSGKKFIDHLPLATITYLHVVRILVEVVLYWLFFCKAIPEIMTFAGKNFDIIAGITAPFVAYLYFSKKMFTRNFMIAWNVICIGLLLNIVIIAILSAPFSFQKLAFDQPNIAVLYFPFIWLPSFIVPVVLFSHLASIRQLLKNKND